MNKSDSDKIISELALIGLEKTDDPEKAEQLEQLKAELEQLQADKTKD